jgi:uncharacterized membrane protein
MAAAKLLAGLCALLLGRRFFWLLVGIGGFVLGAEIATRLFREQPHFVVLLTAVAGGVIGAVLAQRMQQLMIGVVGFIAGSYIGAELLLAAMPYPGRMIWFALFIGGLSGALLAVTIFDWTIIILSSVLGAELIVDALSPTMPVTSLALLGLVALGVVIQASIRPRRRRTPRL